MPRLLHRLFAFLPCVVAAFVMHSPLAGAQPATATELQGRALLSALAGGGYILYFRHASTDFGQNDERMTGYEDCATQRNLTEAGRAEARAIGVALAELRIPVGDVLASRFRRLLHEARSC